ncbi:MAG: GntR family transcriptional regulator [Thermovirgaceae bacterium]
MTDEKNLAEQVYKVIREGILKRNLLPGMKLSALALSQEMGVSRTPVRLALERLAAEGLVEVRSNQSAQVARPSSKTVEEVFFMRALLEAEAVRIAASKVRPADLRTLEDLVDEEQREFHNRHFQGYIKANRELHMAIARLADNSLLEKTIEQFLDQSGVILSLFDPFYAFEPEEERVNYAEDKAILEALAAKNAGLAASRMKDHILRAFRNLPLEELEARTRGMPRLKTREADPA